MLGLPCLVLVCQGSTIAAALAAYMACSTWLKHELLTRACCLPFQILSGCVAAVLHFAASSVFCKRAGQGHSLVALNSCACGHRQFGGQFDDMLCLFLALLLFSIPSYVLYVVFSMPLTDPCPCKTSIDRYRVMCMVCVSCHVHNRHIRSCA